MQPLNLYQIDQDLAEIEAALIEAGGVIDDDLDARYNDLLDARDDKHRSYVAIIRRIEASADAVANERKRLQENERALAASAKRLKDRLCQSMIAAGEDVAETALGKVRVQYAAAGVEPLFEDAEALPDEWKRVTVSADMAGLKQALKDGREDVEQLVRWGERSAYIRIY